MRVGGVCVLTGGVGMMSVFVCVCVCVGKQDAHSAFVSVSNSDISVLTWIVDMVKRTCSCLRPQTAGFPCEHVVAVMRSPNCIVPGNNMTPSFSIDTGSVGFKKWVHQSWTVISYAYSVRNLRIGMLDPGLLELDGTTLPSKRKHDQDAPGRGRKGPSRHKRISSYGESGGTSAARRSNLTAPSTATQVVSDPVRPSCSICGAFTHTMATHFQHMILNRQRVITTVQQATAVIDGVMNFPTLDSM